MSKSNCPRTKQGTLAPVLNQIQKSHRRNNLRLVPSHHNGRAYLITGILLHLLIFRVQIVVAGVRNRRTRSQENLHYQLLWPVPARTDASWTRKTPATFQRAIGVVIPLVNRQFTLFYLENIFIVSKADQQNSTRLLRLLDVPRSAGMLLKL